MNHRLRACARYAVLVVAACLAGVPSVAAQPPSPAPSASAPFTPGDELRAALQALIANFDTISKRMGSAQAADLQERLNADLGWMQDATPPPTAGYTAQTWAARVAGQAHADASIVSEVLEGKSEPLVGSVGLTEHLLASRQDGLLDPFALYIPPNLGPSPTLVILLHGHPEYDTDIIGGRYFRTLADQTGTIVAAPYGRGIYQYATPADDEVYQITTQVAEAFNIPPNRTYLAGYSMGGFAVFKVGREHPDQWAGILAIAGSTLSSDTELVRRAFAGKPVYVVTGTDDSEVSTVFAQSTAVYLDSVGIPTGLYIQPGGTHAVVTLVPMLSSAWHDMLAGRPRASAQPHGTGRVQLPGSIDLPPGVKP